jgi:predicted metalloendopeptidase
MKKILFALIGLFIFQACQETENPTMEEKIPGLDLSAMDTTVSPKEDFFKFINGTWLEKTEIPEDRGRWGSFDELRKNTSNSVLQLLENAGDMDYDKTSDQYKAYTFYEMAMDSNHANKLGIQPIESILTSATDISSVESLQSFIESTESIGLSAFFGFGVGPDARNSKMNTAYLGNGTLGLPERDYYVKEDEESIGIREDYKTHVTKMLGFVGYDEAQAQEAAEKILALETDLAEPRMNKVQRRNPLLRYNKRSMDDLQELLPAINWRDYFKNIGVGEIDTIIVSEPKYIESLATVFEKYTPEDWQHYIKWNTLRSAASYLSQDIDTSNFAFYGKRLRGLESQRPRQERAVSACNWTVGEALGKLYVEAHFPEEAKATAQEMVDNILMAFDQRIRDLEWMTDSTKQKALKKLETFTVKIGYPDEWKDYSALEIKSGADGGSYAGNMMAVSQYNFKEDLEKMGKEVDKKEWHMAPQVVNAYYSPLNNEIVFPAAILQPPFYNYTADAAVNYGGIGAVIGHEISHGFDDSGSRFDHEGNMNNWWTDTDREQFEERNKRLIEQFDSYEVLPEVFVNGAFTLGENIGDLGGLNAAFDALNMYFDKHGKPEMEDGYTPEQRFFISWGTIWRAKYRDETLKTLIKTDPHSPAMFRAIGPLSNFQPFYDAFDIKEGDQAYLPDSMRVKIW